MVLARLLVPEDFGLVASVGPIVAFVALFQNLGLQQAVVQRPEMTDAELNRMFWIMAAVGLACSVAVVLVSPAVAWFYGDPRMRDITIAAGLPLLLGSISGLPLSLLNRHLRFGRLAAIDVANALFGFLAAAVAAWCGLGYWSLLIGSAVSAAVSLAVAWWWSRWTPGRPDFAIDRDIMSFGANLTGFNLVNFFARNLDNILIGKYSGAVELGFYDRAYKLLLFPIQNIITPLSRVMIPLLSRIQDDKPRFRDLYLQTLWVLAFVTIPGVAALICTSEQVVAILFGRSGRRSRRSSCGWGWPAWSSRSATRRDGCSSARARPGPCSAGACTAAATTIAAFIVGLPWGATGVAAAYAISGYVLRIPVLAVLMQRTGPVSAYDFLLPQILFMISSFVMWAIFNVPDGFPREPRRHRDGGDGHRPQLRAGRPARIGAAGTQTDRHDHLEEAGRSTLISCGWLAAAARPTTSPTRSPRAPIAG